MTEKNSNIADWNGMGLRMQDRMPESLASAVRELPDDERAALDRIWRDAGILRRREPTEERLAELGSTIWQALEPQVHATARRARIYALTTVWRWGAIAACALILMIAGVIYARWPQQLVAPHGQRVSLVLSDGSSVELNSGAVLTYAPRTFGWLSRTAHLEGEGYFVIRKNKTPFLLRTFNAQVSVFGTSFNVRAWSDEFSPATAVVLYEGKVRLANAGEPTLSVDLMPGQMSLVSQDSDQPSEPRPTDLLQVAAWRTGRLVFVDELLGTILREMERRFDVEIRVAPSQILQDRLTLSYEEPDGPEVILQDMASSYSRYEYRRMSSGYELFLAPSP